MTVMSAKQEEVLKKLLALAGSPALVEEALRETAKSGRAPKLEEVVEYIAKKVEAQKAEGVPEPAGLK